MNARASLILSQEDNWKWEGAASWEWKLRDEITFIQIEVNKKTFSMQNVDKSFRNLEEQNMLTNNEQQEFNSPILKWQDKFLDKYSR
jgi:hypothetical protein